MSQPTLLAENAAFISYPKQATFGRNLPKNKIYEHSGANTRLKDLFVEQVEQIVGGALVVRPDAGPIEVRVVVDVAKVEERVE